ncbi:MAG: carbohydrate kinase family protein [Candidatus Roizmanbacteria bacterium]|nr:MAG: carbohydrate kinase family protein [Candidatus Roizmanbacteria bacterium]
MDALSHAHITILSDEDLSFEGKPMDQMALDRIIGLSQYTVLTRSKSGSDVYERNKGLIAHANIFKLQENEVKDLTGAGDTYAAGFISRYEETGNLKEAAVFASLYSSLKIMTIQGEGSGMKAAPKPETIQAFVNNNPERFAEFLKDNELTSLPVLIEGNNRPQEKR